MRCTEGIGKATCKFLHRSLRYSRDIWVSTSIILFQPLLQMLRNGTRIVVMYVLLFKLSLICGDWYEFLCDPYNQPCCVWIIVNGIVVYASRRRGGLCFLYLRSVRPENSEKKIITIIIRFYLGSGSLLAVVKEFQHLRMHCEWNLEYSACSLNYLRWILILQKLYDYSWMRLRYFPDIAITFAKHRTLAYELASGWIYLSQFWNGLNAFACIFI